MSLGDYAKGVANKAKNKIKKQVVKVMLPILLKVGIPAIAFIIIVGAAMGVFMDDDSSGSSSDSSSSSGYTYVTSGSVFYDGSFTKEEFIQLVNAYNPGHNEHNGRYTDVCYEESFKNYASEYFEISVKYRI